MAATFATRSLAAQAARRRGIEAFFCGMHDDGTWGYDESPMSDRIRKAIAFGLTKDYVAHVEVLQGEPILIVTCFKEELASEKVPYRVMPLTPSLWESHDEQIRRMSGPLPQGRKPVTGKTERTSPPGAVKMVWGICDANPGAARKDIIDLCEKQGIHKSTAATQYAKWAKANKK